MIKTYCDNCEKEIKTPYYYTMTRRTLPHFDYTIEAEPLDHGLNGYYCSPSCVASEW